MKLILYVALFVISATAHAESPLETDDTFFKTSATPSQDDDLDRAYKKNELIKSTEHQKKVEANVKDEFSSTRQDVMPAYEAQMMDQKIVAENKRRQAAIKTRLNSSSSTILACVAKNPKNFQGTYATVIWMLAADGKVTDTAIKSTDVENTEIQKCIQEAASSLDFSAAKTDLLKKSIVEYTYKFKQKAMVPSVKKIEGRAARR